MGKQDYYPTSENGRMKFLENYADELPGVATTLNLAQEDVNTVTGARDSQRAALTSKTQTNNAAMEARSNYKTLDRDNEKDVRAVTVRIKAAANYTEGIGKRLGIEGAEAAEPPSKPDRPTLELIEALYGETRLGFTKHGHSGVRIYSKRGDETEFTPIAKDNHAPYVDTRANLSPAPERREYCARFLDGDDEVGPMSDVLIVTVPGA